jgi:hypothetical protein
VMERGGRLRVCWGGHDCSFIVNMSFAGVSMS